jgi:coenzyme F420-0:L-glutamate ligase/coenzyme F420-1:gamma-L-glutamate ligase|tara:strand:+ start:207 stop:965 length:759 start_codon:yes stop_codon:yes gene_type:complete
MDRGIVSLISVKLDRPVVSGDGLAALIADAVSLYDGDVVVVASSVVSTVEGRSVSLDDIEPSDKADEVARQTGKDPRHVQLILDQAQDLCVQRDVVLTRLKDGLVCANAGVDRSNSGEGQALILPTDPDTSADLLRSELEARTGKRIGVVVSDSHGRPLRQGCIGVALGASGVSVLNDRRGDVDLFGRPLESTIVALGDVLASAAQLVMGEAGELIPAVVVRGVDALGSGSGKELIRPRKDEIFHTDWARVR